jgi:hypothetical protein
MLSDVVLVRNVDHEPVVALRVVPREAHVLVHVECFHILERNLEDNQVIKITLQQEGR